VKPAASVEDQPIQIRVRGLSPHEVVSLELVSTDARGVRWVSRAKFAAGPSGVIDPARSAPR
jgi:Acyl-CoA thioester hydrolase/BAAT N-terminal region